MEQIASFTVNHMRAFCRGFMSAEKTVPDRMW